MVFGISYGELAAIVVVGAVAFGPKDLPIIARAAGRIVGQAVGYVSALRSRAQTFAEKTQLDELHKELQQTMSQLEAIRYEIQSGANILVPGSMTNRVASRAVEAFTHSKPKSEGGSIPTSVPDVSNMEASGPPHLVPDAPSASFPHHQQAALNFEKAKVNGVPAWQGGGNADGMSKQIGEPLDRRRSERSSVQTSNSQAPGGVETLPISAVSAGLLPKRSDSASGGADILSDAIIEQQISLQAREFIKNMSKPPDPSQP